MGKTVKPEKILQETGGCGLYQVFLCLTVHANKTVTCWSMFTMVIVSKTPPWWCVDDLMGQNATVQEFQILNNVSLKGTCTNLNGSKCSNFLFERGVTTVISEWNLICDRNWIPATLMSIQMAGVFCGNIVAGQMADTIGRKKPLFLSTLIQLIFNTVSVFSGSWLTYAVCRFIIGLGIGGFVTVQYSLMCEFTLPKWRSYVVAAPSWSLEACMFALVAWLLSTWKLIHVAIAVASVFCLLTWRIVPESFRWLLAHDRLNDAVMVISRIARMNKTKTLTINEIRATNVEEDVTEEGTDRKYTVIDIIRSTYLRKMSLFLMVDWFALGFVTYGLQFGVRSWSGNVFLNVFLFNIATAPIMCLSMHLMNKFGRKMTGIISYVICAAASLVVGIVQNTDTNMKDSLTNAFALTASLGIGLTWAPVQTLTTEIYPTVVRNIGFASLNIIGRLGAILGPQLVYLDSTAPGFMYFICFGISICSILSILGLPETNSANLNDKLNEIRTNEAEEEEDDTSDRCIA